MKRMISAVLMAGMLVAGSGPARGEPSAGEVSKQLRELTGGHTRAVWVRKPAKLVFLDTEDGKGAVERSFKGLKPDRPIITPSGKRVVFIDYDKWASYVVDWDGTGLKKVVDGRVTHVRMDADGQEWIYVQTKTNAVTTAPLDNPSKTTVVWQFPTPPRKGKSTNFQTSQDGTRAGATFPWPHCGLARLPQKVGKEFVKKGTGCWPQIARDNSYLFYHCYRGDHKNIIVYTPEGKHWMVRMNPRLGSSECPRWANDKRFLITTDRPGGNRTAWVYVGQFADDFQKIETWLPISRDGANSAPDLWTQPGVARMLAPASGTAGGQTDPAQAREDGWPFRQDGLGLFWAGWTEENAIHSPDGQTLRRCVMQAIGQAVPASAHAAELTGGALLADPASVKAVQAGCRQSDQWTLELVITPGSLDDSAGGTLAALAGDNAKPFFQLFQTGDKLYLNFRSSTIDAGKEIGRLAFCRLIQPIRPAHLVLTYTPGELAGYVNGKLMVRRKMHEGTLDGWTGGTLSVGADADGKNDWAGTVSNLAIYHQALSAKEVAARAGKLAKVIQADPAPVIRVRATLLETTATPDPGQISDYARCLALYKYRVDKVLHGRLKSKTIGVYRWVVLEGKPVTPDGKVGQAVELTLEPFDEEGYLAGERRISDLEEFGLPEFVQIRR